MVSYTTWTVRLCRTKPPVSRARVYVPWLGAVYKKVCAEALELAAAVRMVTDSVVTAPGVVVEVVPGVSER